MNMNSVSFWSARKIKQIFLWNLQADDELCLKKLFRTAIDARLNAYSPYSKYRVGAALLCEDGSIYTGTYSVKYCCTLNCGATFYRFTILHRL